VYVVLMEKIGYFSMFRFRQHLVVGCLMYLREKVGELGSVTTCGTYPFWGIGLYWGVMSK